MDFNLLGRVNRNGSFTLFFFPALLALSPVDIARRDTQNTLTPHSFSPVYGVELGGKAHEKDLACQCFGRIRHRHGSNEGVGGWRGAGAGRLENRQGPITPLAASWLQLWRTVPLHSAALTSLSPSESSCFLKRNLHQRSRRLVIFPVANLPTLTIKFVLYKQDRQLLFGYFNH